MTVAEYKIRTVIILILLLIWAAGAAVKVYIYSVKEQKDLLKKSRRIAWRVAEIPARRGRILDRNGAVLAEDAFCCDLLLLRLPVKEQQRKNLLLKLRESATASELPEKTAKFPLVLRKNLTAEEITGFTRIFRRCPEIHVSGRLERRYSGNVGVRKLLGSVAQNDRRERVGVSGLEQEHDLKLSGRCGQLKVMLDRNGSWIYETLQVVRQPENGRDVRLSETIEELEKRGEAGK